MDLPEFTHAGSPGRVRTDGQGLGIRQGAPMISYAMEGLRAHYG